MVVGEVRGVPLLGMKELRIRACCLGSFFAFSSLVIANCRLCFLMSLCNLFL